jgi:methionine aminotransferase
MIALGSKLPDIDVTIFTVMSQLANDHLAINLSQGFPDFDASSDLIERVSAHMKNGSNQYAPMQGVAVLRQKIARKIQDLYLFDSDPDTEITVTSGATEALYAAITSVVRTGDEVIIFEPAYDAYAPVVRLNNGIPVFLQLTPPDYRIDWDEVGDKLSEKTRLIILNSPHNPTGTILKKSDMTALETILDNTGILILSDEVYEHIVFDHQVHESILRYPSLAARSYVVSSFGKTYHTTGWKIGYCIAPEALTREFRRVHQFLTFSSNTPIQLAYADILEQKHLYRGLASFYQKKRDAFLSYLEGSRFKPVPCSGTYFQMMQYHAVSDMPDIDFARWMTIEHGVACIPVSVFYHARTDHKVVRFCFAKREATLERAAEKLCRV